MIEIDHEAAYDALQVVLNELVDAINAVRGDFTPEMLNSIKEISRGRLDLALIHALVYKSISDKKA